MLEPNDLLGRVRGHRFDCILVAEVIRTFDAIESMIFRRIVLTISERRVDSALGRAGMTANRVHFRYDGNVGSALSGFDCGAHPGEATADDDNVVLYQVQRAPARSVPRTMTLSHEAT